MKLRESNFWVTSHTKILRNLCTETEFIKTHLRVDSRIAEYNFKKYNKVHRANKTVKNNSA